MAERVVQKDAPPAARADSNSEEESSSEESSRPSTSSSDSEAMPPPALPLVSTPPSAAPAKANSSTGPCTPGEHIDDRVETRSSRSASTASRSNRLSLTLPIALPHHYSTRPIPASATAPTFPATPVDLQTGATAGDPTDFITAIAAQERHVLELRETLKQAEDDLAKLKLHWARAEARKKRPDAVRRHDHMRSMPARPGSVTDYSPVGSPSMDGGPLRRSSELDRRRLLLQSQQAGTSEPSTPSQSRRRVFKGGHARTLSLLSPTKTSSDGFSVHEDQGDDDSIRSPMSLHDPDSPFLQNVGRYAPSTANKRASWAPQSVHQVTGAGLRQVAGELTSTLWTFVEDIRQAAVGEDLPPAHGASREAEGSHRAADDSTIRAPSSSSRPQIARAFGDVQGTLSAQARTEQSRDVPGNAKLRASKLAKSGDGKSKRFSFTPLTVDSYDDNDWENWDTPAVKSPRWSGSTANGEISDANLDHVDENTAPRKRDSVMSAFSTASTPGNKNSELYAALNKLAPSNLKRTATDLMKEWEKSLAAPSDGHPDVANRTD